MSPVPLPTLVVPREEWTDADFDIPEGVPLHAPSDKDEDDDEDWDFEMNLGKTGGAKAQAVVAGIVARSDAAARKSSFASSSSSQTPTVRPHNTSTMDAEDEDEDGEGVSTIKATALPLNLQPKIPKQPLPQIIDDEDFEDGFALPSDLTRLSLAPQSLASKSSKSSLEWGDKDSSSSSQSSDAYSSLGFADTSPSSNAGTSVSLPDTETEEEEDDLDGLVIPNALFESKQSARHLNKILETKKKTDPAINQVKVASHNPEDDFEAGLIIEDDVDLSPSRLLSNSQHQHQPQRTSSRSNSIPPPRPSSLRPPSRAKPERSKSPSNPPPSSQRQLQKIRLSPSPPLRPPTRSQTFQAFGPPPPIPSPTRSPSSSFLTPKPGSLRGQKSHSGLKPPTPPSSARQLQRKASLSVIESSQKQISRTPSEGSHQPKLARYEEPTVASRAKSHKSSTSRIHDLKVPPTRPSTPSSNPAALRLTMPTQSRLKSRPALSSVFGPPAEPPLPQPPRAISPLPPAPRPPSSASLRPPSRVAKHAVSPTAPKILKKPKGLQRTYGDGTELDGFDDLPLNQEKEGLYRVHPKGHGNRVPGSSFQRPLSRSAGDNPSDNNRGTIRRSRRDISSANVSTVLAPTTNTLRRTTTSIDFPPKQHPKSTSEALPKKRKPNSPNTTRRKPTLIRNLGSNASPKVIGDMKWNPITLRWEGNDQVLREFDAAMGTSIRPALITHLTGSSIGSPVGNFSNGARVVGNMYFDPQQMRWISTLPPDEDEPDVFANLADDEDDSDAWEGKSGTIRASAQAPRASDASSATSGSEFDSRMIAPSPVQSHSRTISDSGSDRGSRASMYIGDVDEDFAEKCRQAEARHRTEMKGWKTALSNFDPYPTPATSHLWEIRALATRKY